MLVVRLTQAINSGHNHKVIWIAESVQSQLFESEA